MNHNKEGQNKIKYRTDLSEQFIRRYSRQNRQFIKEMTTLYDSQFKEHLTQQNKLYKNYRLNNKINYDNLRQYASSLNTFTEALFKQITYSTYETYLNRFYQIMYSQINQILDKHRATYNDLSYCFFIRTVYYPYKGYHAELLIQQSINSSNYLTASYSAHLDKAYGVDLIISDKSNTFFMALQIKSKGNLVNTMSRMKSTEQMLNNYYSKYSIPYYYIFYDSSFNIVEQHQGKEHNYLFTYQEIEQVQSSRNRSNILSCSIDELVHHLEWLFMTAEESDNDSEA